jgi:hypothetical protein
MSRWLQMSFTTTPAGILPGQRMTHGTRNAPSQFEFFSLRNGVIPASGQLFNVRTVVGRVHDERVVGDAELVEQVEQRADGPVVIDHRVVVWRLPPPGLADAFGLRVGAEMHVRGVDPREERGARSMLAADELGRCVGDLVVDRLHPLLAQRTGILHAVRPLPVCPGMQDPAGTEPLSEVREVSRRRVVG